MGIGASIFTNRGYQSKVEDTPKTKSEQRAIDRANNPYLQRRAAERARRFQETEQLADLTSSNRGFKYTSGTTVERTIPTGQREVVDVAAQTKTIYTTTSTKVTEQKPIVSSNTFMTADGKGFSSDPNLVLKSIGSSTYGLTPVEYFSGRKDVISTGANSVYGKDYASDSTMFKSPEKSNFFTSVSKSKFIVGVGKAYSDTESSVSSAIKSNIEPNLYKFDSMLRGKSYGSPSKELISVNVPLGREVRGFTSGIYSEVSEKPIKTYATIGIFAGIGSVIGRSTTLLNVASKPVVKYGLGALTVAGVGYSAFTSPEGVGKSLGRQAISIGAAGIGLNLGLSGTKSQFDTKVLTSKYRDTNVRSVETLSSVSKSKSFGSDIVVSDRSGLKIISGTSDTQGRGVFSIANKYYILDYSEKGFYRSLKSGVTISRASGNIGVQPFEYKFGLGRSLSFDKITFGVPKSFKLSAEQVEFPLKRDGVTGIRSVASISSKGLPSVKRVTSALATTKGDVTKVGGISVDLFRGKRVAGSAKVLADTSVKVASISDSGVTTDVYKNLMLGKSFRTSIFSKGIGSNVRSFNNGDFISSASSTGSSTVSKPVVISSNIQSQISQTVKTAFISDVRSSGLSKLSSVGKTILSVPSSKSILKTSTVSKPMSVLKSSTSLNQVTSYDQVSYLKTSIVSRTSPISITKTSTSLKTASDTVQLLKQDQVLKQSTALRQTGALRLSTPLSIVPMTSILPFKFSKSFDGQGKKRRKSSVSFNFFGKPSKSNVYILPDLASVSSTEAKNFTKGLNVFEARTPKATKKVVALSTAAFKGYGGFVPTEEMRKIARL